MSQYLQRLMHMTGLCSSPKMQYSDRGIQTKHMDSPLEEVHEHTESKPVRAHIKPAQAGQTQSIVQKKEKSDHQEKISSPDISPSVGHEKISSPDIPPSMNQVKSNMPDQHEIIFPSSKPNIAMNSPIIKNDVTTHQNQPNMNHSHVKDKPVESQPFNLVDALQPERPGKSRSDKNVQPDIIVKKSKPDSYLKIQDNSDPVKIVRRPAQPRQNPTFQEIRAWVAEPLSKQVQPDSSDGFSHQVGYDQSQVRLTDKKLQSITQDKSGVFQSQNLEVQDVQLSIGDIHLTIEAPPEEKTVREPSSRQIRKNPEQSQSRNRLERHYVRF